MKENPLSQIQGYLMHNIDNYKRTLETSDSLIDKFKAESKLEAFRHAQQYVTHLQYEESKEGESK
jgi:hypothetical protein